MHRLYLLSIISLAATNSVHTFPNLSIIKSGKYYYCTITNDTQSSALLWDHQNTDNTPSNNIHCNLDENSKCELKDKLEDNWQWIDDKNVSPILDYRWESFNTLELEFYPKKIYETDDQNFRISFSVKVKELHIFLCDVEYSNHYGYGNCYWIDLGANDGEKSYIRKCVAGRIPTDENKHPEKECAYIWNQFNGNTTNVKQWNHFTIFKQANTITVWKHGLAEPILRYTDGSWNMFAVKYVLARETFSQIKYMKIHKAKVLTTNKTSTQTTIRLNNQLPEFTNCLALYVKVCEECSFVVKLTNSKVVLNELKSQKSEDWQEILLEVDKNWSSETEISLETVSEAQDNFKELYWQISNTIRKCGKTDSPMKRSDGDGCCYALKYPNQSICTKDMKNAHGLEDWSCPANTIGRNCIPCSSIPNDEKCNHSKICDLTSNGSVCSCAAGYRGEDCQYACPLGRYGPDCRKKCGRCVDTCNEIDGTCKYCEKNFEGDACQTAILPLLKNAPKIEKIGYTNVTILAGMEYEGKERPRRYQILYQDNGIWIQHGVLMPYENVTQSYVVTNLNKNTKYKIKVILHTITGARYIGKYVPVTEVETTCADITEDILLHEEKNTSITLSVNPNETKYEEVCPLSQYRLFVFDETSIYVMHNRQFERKNSIEPLKPYTNYTIGIKKDNMVVVNMTIRTAEGIPSAVQNILHNSTDTTVGISWTGPLFKHGHITEYRIQYLHVKNNICPENHLQNKSSTIITTKDTEALISNLLPFSEYVAKIWAVGQYEGVATQLDFETKITDTPKEDEFPNTIFTESNRYLNVTLTWLCGNLKGPLRYRAELTCTSEWCSEQTQNYSGGIVVENRVKPSTITFERIGKTEYIFKFFLSRNGKEISSGKKFISRPNVPGPVRNVFVYSKNATSVSIRWLPPYPTEGDVESYWIWDQLLPTEVEVRNAASCRFWPEYMCATITDLKSNFHYNFRIRTKNRDVFEIGAYTDYIPAYTKEEVPEPPRNITVQWDQHYGLLVRWLHPNVTNGNLRQFLLFINDSDPINYPITEENQQYEHKINIPRSLTLQTLAIGVAASNSAGNSNVTSTTTLSPPKTPRFLDEPNIDRIGETSLDISIPSILEIEGETSYMYVIVTDKQNPVSHDFLHPAERHLLARTGIDADFSWVAGEFDLSNENNNYGLVWKVGDGTKTISGISDTWKLFNRKLIPENPYEISIILNNTSRRLSRYRLYALNSKTQPEERFDMNYLFILLVVPVLTCLVVFLVKKVLSYGK